MSEDLKPIRDALLRAIPRMPHEMPRRDLWSDLVRRVTVRRVAWFDWILSAAAVAASLGLPSVVPTLLYLL